MAEKDTIFSSKIKYGGIFSFADFYRFCYDWLTEETGLSISESKYEEKLDGESKSIGVVWLGSRTITDYFKFEVKVTFKVIGLTKVELTKDGAKIKTNKGGIEVGIKGILIRDHRGKFEATAFNKFLRGIYEKWVITSRIDEMEDKIVGDCDEFLSQAKAYLDLEGKK
ncbi:hypothetical protein KAR52_01660 [Candidatus Pacearchaeota archaeon]|nr:hypothetical protein [Candidatus Pacearchaeota archaeon]